LDVHGSSNVGALTTTSVSGDGSGLTSLNAGNISSGTIDKDRLPTTLNNTTIGSLAVGTNDVTLTGKQNYHGLKIIKAFDHPDEPATLLLAGDGDTGDDIAFEIRGNGTGSDVDTTTTRDSDDTTFGILHTGHTYIGYPNLNPGETGGNAQNGDPMLNVSGDIYATGNVGIGTTSPGSKLDIYTGSTSTVGLSLDRFSSGNYRTDIYQNSYGPDFRVGYGSYTPESILYLKRLSNGSKEVEINGNVGIGTTSPNGNLHIMSDLANASSQINPSAQLVLHSSLAGLDDDGDIGASLVFTQRWLDSSPNSHGTMGSIHGFKDLSAGNYGGGLLFKTQPGSDTAPVERMRIDRDGNVGIGLTSPVYTLDVNGVSRSRGVCVNSGFGNGTARPALTTGSTHPSYEIRSIGGNGNVGSAGGDDGFLRLRAGGGTGTNSASYIDLSGYSTYSGGDMKRNIVFGTLGTERMRIKENGNVGIGESSPSYKLDVNGDTRVGNVLYIGKNTNDETAKTIYFGGTYGDNGYDHCVIERRVWSTGTEKQELLLFSGNDGENSSGPDRIRLKGAQILFDTLNSSTDRTTENTKMIIRADGDVGIGTTNPQTKLHVNGEISNNNPGCRVGQNATQYTLPSSSTNVLKYNYVFYDTGSDYSTSTGLFTCPVAGKYLCIHMMTSRSTRTRSAISETKIFWNGVEVSRQFMDVTQDSSTGTVIIDAAVNDTLNAGIWNGNSNNEYNGINDGGGSQFFVHFLG
jgi:hypothetical protein